MLLGAKLLKNNAILNDFKVLSQVVLKSGDPTTIYFQLVNREAETKDLRYIPSSTATVTVTFPALDQAKIVTKTASKVFPTDDRSIWKVTLNASDKVFTGDIRISLVEGADTFNATIQQALQVEQNDNTYC